jgi:D-serine dehydratase
MTQPPKNFALADEIIATQEVFWVNPTLLPFDEARHLIDFKKEDELEAADRLERFRPYLSQVFPEVRVFDGVIESELVSAPTMQAKLKEYCGVDLPGQLMIKLDNLLPISGSIKARGGIYEVLKHAETLAVEKGILDFGDDYSILDTDRFRSFFSGYSLIVGSTGNLGLSIGIMGKKLGFNVIVHMSADAQQWKKDLLRIKGALVKEYEADYGHAVAQGRADAESDEYSHFVDDESSRDLFLGYAVAASRLKQQLDKQGIIVDEGHPLFIYLPCGVGGGPGGVSFGLKLTFGDNVHCIFAEPTHAPAVLLGLATGLHEKVCAQDYAIDGLTAADGLAVSRPSGLVCRTMEPLLDGIYTIEDDVLHELITLISDTENIKLEPSAAAGLPGIARVLKDSDYLCSKGLEKKMNQATHIVWATGGSMVPDSVWKSYYQRGKVLLSDRQSRR